MQSNSEVLSGLVVGRMRDGRCRYDPQVKQELVGQCMLPGVSVARMAMQHGVNANLLRAWISKWKTKSQSSQAITVRRAVSETATWDAQEVPAFVPVQVEAGAVSAADASSAVTAMPTKACGVASKSAAVSASASMRIQLQLPNGISVDLGQARVEELAGVMRMLCHLPCSR
jgi:transposase